MSVGLDLPPESIRFFGTDGVRGVAGEGLLTSANVGAIALAAASELVNPGDLVCIGYDTRESSEDIAQWAAAGVMLAGADVELQGVVTTPALSYAVSHAQARAGIMITASHNPWTDNGIKIFGSKGGKIHDSIEDRIEERVRTVDFASGPNKGRAYYNERRIASYARFLMGTTTMRFDGLRIAVDVANGSATAIGDNIIGALGAEVASLSNRPSGRNINAQSGATDTRRLERSVVDGGFDLGVAYDGDADRCILVDQLGRKFDGDRILHMKAFMDHVADTVVTRYSNGALAHALEANGLRLHRTENPGDRPVLVKMLENGYRLGGEQSGHIIFNEDQFYRDRTPTGDGILTAIQTIANLRRSGGNLSDWYDSLTMLPQALIKVGVPGDVLRDPRVRNAISQRAAIIQQEGGRLYVRPSGTEGGVRVLIEGNASQTKEDAKAHADEVRKALRLAA